jgi:uncharacterized protein (DUF2235 family)
MAAESPKNIVVCLDGTRNQNETQNTNVHRIYEMLDKNVSVQHYWSGVGVGGMFIGNALDSISGRGVFRAVRSAFTFIRGNYQTGDRIFVFGFSRGAFAARHLAGMIVRMGFGLPAETSYERYRKLLATGAATETRQVVDFLGMFDCVPGNQLYLLKRTLRSLNEPVLEAGITNVAHAVSRDERRWSFKPLLFRDGGQQTFHQVWFPGYHFDLGGDDNPPLNGFALWWMLREAYGYGLALTAIKCPSDADGWHHGRLGVKLGFMPEIDSEAPGHPSDYWTTRRGLRCERMTLPDAPLISPQPDLAHLDLCPRGCGEELFDFFLTDEGKRRFTKFLARATIKDR